MAPAISLNPLIYRLFVVLATADSVRSCIFFCNIRNSCNNDLTDVFNSGVIVLRSIQYICHNARMAIYQYMYIPVYNSIWGLGLLYHLFSSRPVCRHYFWWSRRWSLSMCLRRHSVQSRSVDSLLLPFRPGQNLSYVFDGVYM